MKNKHISFKQALMLFLSFFKIGAFTFGGGYAMIPLIEKEASDKRKWVSSEDILDIIAVAESTPGPIAINAATFIGYRTGGFIGALAATLGVVLPSLCIILAIATVLNNFHNIAVVQHAFWGIRIGVLALVIKAFLTVQKQCPKNLFSYCIAVAAFIAVVFLNINVFAVIICSAAAGFILSLIMAKGDRK